jgi:hypothetical protein
MEGLRRSDAGARRITLITYYEVILKVVKKLNSVAVVRKRPQLVGEVSANLCR